MNSANQKFILEYSQLEDVMYSHLDKTYQKLAIIPFQMEAYIGLQCTQNAIFLKWESENNPTPVFFDNHYKKTTEKADDWILTFSFTCAYDQKTLARIVGALMNRCCLTHARLLKDEVASGYANCVYKDGEIVIGPVYSRQDASFTDELIQELHFQKLM
ncbi:hypothetical protein [Listeria booriae]|uniref:hypothetical protein n=1 Tax=Listeria booriae TaxID=1552123 RepID=UPI001625AC78|nr:hypothetical protein [Listeria booriae]MBC2080848.1 hypothetical protein [Listeria booriae]MBC2324645.1 hypothetical protein [Listeria booriae]